MRHLLLFLFLLLPGASIASQGDSSDATRNYSRLMEKGNAEFLEQLTKRLQAAGFRKVQIIPQMFVAVIMKEHGQPGMIIVDYNTMRTFEVKDALDFVKGATNTPGQTDVPVH